MQLDFTITTEKPYAEAVVAVQETAARNGFRVQAVHDVQATLAEKGFEREPLSIVEICNAKHAHAVLAKDVLIGLMLPCPVMVHEVNGVVSISTMLPTLIGSFFPEAGVEDSALEVESALKQILHEAAA